MEMNNVRLVSTVVCDDVLVNAADRTTLYGIFRDMWASGYPAEVVRLHVVTTWFNPTQAAREVTERVAILAPDGELVADAAITFTVGPGWYHSQVSRFRDLVAVAPGQYRVQVQAGTELVEDLPLLMTGPASDEGGAVQEGV
jgi:hypothetical protein